MAGPSYYEHSGKFSPPGLAITFLGGSIAAALLGVIYSYAITFIPIGGWITFLLAIGYGFGMGATSGYAVRFGKIRNTALATFLGTLVAGVGLYFSWAVWMSLLFGESMGSEFAQGTFYFVSAPGELFEAIRMVNEVGAWTMESFTPTGVVLWILWALETVLILGPAIAMVVFMLSPFCENCEKWCEGDEELGRISSGAANHDLIRNAEQRNWAFFREVGATDNPMFFTKLSVESCPTCSEMNVLKTERITVSVDDNGNNTENSDTVFEGLVIGSGDKAELRAALGSFG
jgi:hypothetical protein